MKIKYIVGGLIIIVALIVAGLSFQSSLSRYVTITEAKSSGSMVQVKGQRLDAGTFDLKSNLFTFTIADENGEKLLVQYEGMKPGNFEQATHVVCKGQYKDGKFYATDLLVKCPSKYEEEKANL